MYRTWSPITQTRRSTNTPFLLPPHTISIHFNKRKSQWNRNIKENSVQVDTTLSLHLFITGLSALELDHQISVSDTKATEQTPKYQKNKDIKEC
jgi:hypothetical protein